jgi:hypothetical protein
MSQKLISMSTKELSRYEVIQRLINGNINGTDAAKQMDVTVRHVKRLKIKVAQLGAVGLMHGGRGQESNRKLSDERIAQIEKYIQETYYDFGPTLAAEKLEENHSIKVGKETVRQIMIRLKLWEPTLRKQPKKRHVWRARKDNVGEMEQFDGCYHMWFGDIESCLLLSVDDACGKITHATFDYHEGIIPVFKFWLAYIKKHGFPMAIYLDKFSTYKINHKHAVDNKDMITQFQRAMNQVDVRLITAHSPQAKGRVERMFDTLQDRLVKELRLAGITSMEEANVFLETYIPIFNAKFAVVPARKKDMHKKPIKQIKEKLPQIFSIQNTRTVMNDYTVRFENDYFQLNEIQPTTVYKKDIVIMEKHVDGNIKIRLKEQYLNYTILPQRPKKEIDITLPAITTKKQSTYRPPTNHPWRKPFLLSSKTQDKKTAEKVH